MAKSNAIVTVTEDLVIVTVLLLLVAVAASYFSGFGPNPLTAVSAWLQGLLGQAGGEAGSNQVDQSGNAVAGSPPNLLAPHGTVNLPSVPGLYDQTGVTADGAAYDVGNW